jgi:hypothetical protein
VRTTAQTEPKATRAMMVLLATKLPQPVDVTKHADQFTSGIPDVTAAWQGFTSWLECKMLKPGKTLDSELGDDQLLYCRRLEGATNRRCWVVVWNLRDRDNHFTEIYAPSLIVEMRRQGREVPENGWPMEFKDRVGALDYERYVKAKGVNHALVMDLIRGTHRFGWSKADSPGR